MAETAQDRVALVTGAGSGVGREIARLLAARGWKPALVGRTEGKLAETRDMIAEETGDEDANERCLVLKADIAKEQDATRAIEACVERFGRLDALINNAGYAPLKPIDQTDPQTLREAFEINALGPGWLILAAWPTLKRQRSGRIVNISTIGTHDPFPGFFAYAAAKAAVNLYTLSCAKEGKAIGVKAFCVAPGAIETPMLRANFDEKMLPRDRCMSPEEVARVAVACAVGERDDDNGRTIVMAGPGTIDVVDR